MPYHHTAIELTDQHRRRLRARREQLGWTQEELAERAGCTKNMVALVERGERAIGWPLLVRISRALGLEVRLELVRRRGQVNRR